MFVRKVKFFTFLFLIFVVGCVQINLTQKIIHVNGIEKIGELSVSFRIKNFSYSNIDSTFFVMDENYKIHIIKNDKEVNIIGGIGFGKDQFRELTDFCIDKNGHLLTLDRIRKKLLIFNEHGDLLTKIDISFINYPIFIAQLESGYYVSFDNTTKEAVIFPEWKSSDIFKFGQFEINQPVFLKTNFSKIIFYDAQTMKTLVYDDFGNLIKEISGKVLFDKYGNAYNFSDHIIKQGKIQSVSFEKIKLFDILDKEILIAGNNKIGIYRIKYEK